jgi:hypothetical protein
MKYTLNFKDTTIRAGGHKILVTQAGTDFRPDRLEVPPDLAPDFEIDGIRVGEKDQLPVSVPGMGTSAIMFAANAFGVRWNDGGMTIAPIGTNIMVSVRNISKQTKTFRCCVIGNMVGEDVPKDIEDEERIDAINRKLEEEMRQESAKPLEESRLAGLETRVMMLQERADSMEMENNSQDRESKTEILVMLADLFDAQISAVLIAAGCQKPGGELSGESSKEYALGFGSTLVPAKSSANISVQPQVVFRPERLVIPASIAEDFLITDIKVGKNSQLVSTGAIPASAFTNHSEPSRMKMDTAQIAMFVTVSVTNTSKEDKFFQCAIFGPSVDPSWVSTSAKRFSARRFW